MQEPVEFVPLSVEEMQALFPNYEIVAFIAAGGMGAVYMAKQTSIDRTVAIKILPRELSSDAEFSNQFKAEAKVMSQLNHPNLIGFFDLGSVDEMLFIVMEFVDGKSLHHSAHGTAIDQNVALNIVRGIAEGLEHAHVKGLLHRDIKPANILLDQGAFPKIGDFGLARPVEESEAGKVIFGTPGYTAPEVVEDPESIDVRSDIYSVGAILYELLTGHLPEDRYRPPSRTQGVDPAFDRVVQRAIAFSPENRYSSISDFLTDLKTIQVYHEKGEIAPKTSLVAPSNAKETGQNFGTANLKQNKVFATSGSSVKAGRPQQRLASHKPALKKKSNNTVKYAFILILLVILGVIVSLVTSRKDEMKLAQKEARESTVLPLSNEVESSSAEENTVNETVPTEELLKTLEKNRLRIKDKELKSFPSSAVVTDDKIFMFYPMEYTWSEAYVIANRYAGSLVSLTSEENKDFVTSLLRDTTDAWVGGGYSGDSKGYSWLDGSDWVADSEISGRTGYIAINNLGELSFQKNKERKPFVIVWTRNDANKGWVGISIPKLVNSFKEENLAFIPGVHTTENSVYLVSKVKKSWNEANRICKEREAKLAIPNSATEFQFMSELIENAHGERLGVWIGGQFNNGALRWIQDESVPMNRWIKDPDTGQMNAGIVMYSGLDAGWMLEPKEEKRHFLYEWKRNPNEEQESETSKEKTRNDGKYEDHKRFIDKVRIAQNSALKKKDASQKKLMKDARWGVNQWLKALTTNRQETFNQKLVPYFARCERQGKLLPIGNLKIPEELKMIINRLIAKQQKLYTDYDVKTLKFRDALAGKLNEQIPALKENGMLNETLMLERLVAKIRPMNEQQFVNFLKN